MPRSVEETLARAKRRFAGARYTSAIADYRAVLTIDPLECRAHLGLADCYVACGQKQRGVASLVHSAGAVAGRGNYDDAFTLYARALEVDPERLDLHLDVADLEFRSGSRVAATTRLETLARIYAESGRPEDSEAVLEFAKSRAMQSEADAEIVPSTTESSDNVVLEEPAGDSSEQGTPQEGTPRVSRFAERQTPTEPHKIFRGTPTRKDSTQPQEDAARDETPAARAARRAHRLTVATRSSRVRTAPRPSLTASRRRPVPVQVPRRDTARMGVRLDAIDAFAPMIVGREDSSELPI